MGLENALNYSQKRASGSGGLTVEMKNLKSELIHLKDEVMKMKAAKSWKTGQC